MFICVNAPVSGERRQSKVNAGRNAITLEEQGKLQDTTTKYA
jgi:hypothetical protein